MDVHAMRRWYERALGARSPAEPMRAAGLERELHRCAEELEQGLRDIDFDEVTIEDRITFVELAVAWQVRRALGRGRFDLAVRLQHVGAERIARLYESRHGWRPVLLYGVPASPAGESGEPAQPWRLRRPRSGPNGGPTW